MAKSWRGIGTASGGAIGRITIKVYQCNGCGAPHKGKKPAQCHCGRMDFEKFDSRGEFNRYANLQMQERAGLIRNLVRQIKFPLKALNPAGQEVVFANYIADACYEICETGEQVIEDYKSLITPEAKLKLKCMEAIGLPVKIVTSKGL